MKISMIVAMAHNNVIGNSNTLPWDLPADMKRFIHTTKGKTVVMGRKTYESIGKPLKGRTNIIVTRNKDYCVEGAIVVHSLEAAVHAVEGDEMVIVGGGSLYAEALRLKNFVDVLYITKIDASIKGDTYFPPVYDNDWVVKSRVWRDVDEDNMYAMEFIEYWRK